ncbi:MAG: TetR/AcrR family transcriptional regulator C-terminal domain-containing protein [Pseudomonadota bacterium]
MTSQNTSKPERIPRNIRGRPSRIDRSKIVEAAMSLPPEDLTIANVAKVLGVRTPTLYYHIAGIDELRVLMVDQISMDLHFETDDAPDWRTLLERYAHEFRRWLKEEPMRLYLVERIGPISPGASSMIADSLARLRDQGMGEKLAIHAFFMISHFIQSYVIKEYEHQTKPEGYDTMNHKMSDVASGLNKNTDVFGTLLNMMEHWDMDEYFEFQLKVMLDGIACNMQSSAA